MAEDAGELNDLGPQMVAELADPGCGLKALVVVDNVAAGPSIGGVRLTLEGTVEECRRLARAMTLKNAAAGLPHGGGKSIILADPKIPPKEKEHLVRAFARRIADIRDYIPGPDMGSNEVAMAWVRDETGRAVGLPPEIGGIPLDVIGATGLGVAVAAEEAQSFAGIPLEGARIAIQGYGSVGRHAARFLTQRGARIVAVSDSRGCALDPAGLELTALAEAKASGSVGGLGGCGSSDRDAILDVDCDYFIPAARPDVIRADTVARIKAKVVVSGANIAVAPGMEEELARRGILSVPDFIANAGGVICAAVEYRGGSQAQALHIIEEKVRENTRAVLTRAREEKVTPMAAAQALAVERVRRAMSYGRRF